MNPRNVLLFLIATISFSRAEEKFPLLQVGSETYSNVVITKVSSTDIYFTFDKGVANAKLKKLDAALQEHFREQAAKSAVMEQKEKEAAEYARSQNIATTNSAPIKVPDALDNQPLIDAQAEIDSATAKIKQIANQPVAPVERANLTGYWVNRGSKWIPGWAQQIIDLMKGPPEVNFATADVRISQRSWAQETTENPDNPVFFVGLKTEPLFYRAEKVGFNLDLLRFYEDLALPKKQLTEDELIEINRLFRIIAKNKGVLAGDTNIYLAPVDGPIQQNVRP